MLSLIKDPKFLLFSLVEHTKSKELISSELDEAASLIKTFGGQVVEVITQNMSHLSVATYIGKGKIDEIVKKIAQDHIDVVTINAHLSASQLLAVKTVLEEANPDIEVWDRTNLILHIFKQHAGTAEAKLQIKLAEVKHRGPMLHGMGKQMSQQGAGIGTRGMGETNTTIMKQHWQAEIQRIEAELKTITGARQQQMNRRKRLDLPTVSIVGYTNAGKSTLFNLLTKKTNLVQDALFATLDSAVGKLYLPDLGKEVFITDTIGFIQNLPTELIQAFKSTLMETINADLLLHVIDISDPLYESKIETVNQILSDLNIKDKPQLFVFNKVDLVDAKNNESLIADLRFEYQAHHPLFISASSDFGVDDLTAAIEKSLRKEKSAQ